MLFAVFILYTTLEKTFFFRTFGSTHGAKKGGKKMRKGGKIIFFGEKKSK